MAGTRLVMMLSFPQNNLGTDSAFQSVQTSVTSFWKIVDRQAAIVRLRMLEELQHEPDQLDKELPNFQSSMRWLRGQLDDESASLFLSYLNLIFSYLQIRNRDFELEQWCTAGLEASKRLDRNAADILLRRGEAQYALGHWHQAQDSWQAAEIASQGENSIVNARAVFALGRLQLNRGNYKMALSTLARAEALFENLGDQEATLNIRSEIAAYYLNRRELDKALRLYLDIDQDYKNTGGRESSDHSLLMLGVVYRQKKIYDKAIQCLSALYKRGEQQHRPSAVATAAHHLAWTYLELEQLEKAQTLCGQALSLYDDIQDPRGLSDAYEQLGAILLKQENTKDAVVFFEKSSEIRSALGNQPGLASCLRQEVFAHFLDGNYKQTFVLLMKTLFLYIRLRMLTRHRMMAIIRDFSINFKRRLSLRIARNTINS
jgi:tetratricopeptide (TPR) repeat protein